MRKFRGGVRSRVHRERKIKIERKLRGGLLYIVYKIIHNVASLHENIVVRRKNHVCLCMKIAEQNFSSK